jgi:hypothetical protein
LIVMLVFLTGWPKATGVNDCVLAVACARNDAKAGNMAGVPVFIRFIVWAGEERSIP